MTLKQLNDMYSQYTGLRIDIASLIEGAEETEDKQKVYEHLMWHLRKGRITERPADQDILEELVPAIQEALNIEEEPSVIEEVETYPVLTITLSGTGTSEVTVNNNQINSGAELEAGTEVNITINPYTGKIPVATLNGNNITLTEDNDVYTGSFEMPSTNSTLIIDSDSGQPSNDFN